MTDKKYPWGHNRPFNDYSSYVKKKFGGRVQKLSLNVGFSCPNRDGTIGKGGCTYCNNTSFNPKYCKPESGIEEQLKKGINFFRKKYSTQKYLAYFQAYTNTHAPLSELIKLYETALLQDGIIGLVIATRPDCVSAELLDYISELSKKYYIIIEYGIESTNDKTLKRINRGHTFAQARDAIIRTAEKGIFCGAHLIMGLPGESRADILKQADIISSLPVNNLKLHQLQINKNTKMAEEFALNPQNFDLFEPMEYVEFCADFLERLRPSIVVERFASESPLELLIAPRWGGYRNYELVVHIEKMLRNRKSRQGKYSAF